MSRFAKARETLARGAEISSPVAQSGLIRTAGQAARSSVEGYDPERLDSYFDGVSQQLADKGSSPPPPMT
jgi:hypothetical protein